MKKNEIFNKIVLASVLALILISTLISAYLGSDGIYIFYTACLLATIFAALVERPKYFWVFSILSFLIVFTPLFFVRFVYGLGSGCYPVKNIQFGLIGVIGYICFTILNVTITYVGWIIYKHERGEFFMR